MDNNSFKDSLSELEAIKNKALSIQEEVNAAKKESLAISDSLGIQEVDNVTKYAEAGASAQIDALSKVSVTSTKKSKTVIEEWASAFKSISNSAKDFGDLASNIFDSLSSSGGIVSTDTKSASGTMISTIFKSLLKNVLGGSFAEGGRPDSGRISLVGEQGPELFVPDSAGTIVPNDELKNSATPVVYQNFTFQSLDPATNMKLLQAQKNQIQAWVTEGIKNNQNGLRSTIKTV